MQAVARAMQFVTSAQAQAESGAAATVERAVVIDALPILMLGLVEDREPIEPGGRLIYTLLFGNRGNVNASGVELRAPVPLGTSFVTASDGGTVVEGAVSWMLGTIDMGESGQRQFSVAVAEDALDGSVVGGEAEIRDAASLGTNARATVTNAVRQSPPLILRLTATPDPVRPGDILTYSFTVSNQGAIDLTEVQLSTLVPTFTTTDEERITDNGNCETFFVERAPRFSGRWHALGRGSRTVAMTAIVNTGNTAPPDGTLLVGSARVFHPEEGLTAVNDIYTRVCAGGRIVCDASGG